MAARARPVAGRDTGALVCGKDCLASKSRIYIILSYICPRTGYYKGLTRIMPLSFYSRPGPSLDPIRQGSRSTALISKDRICKNLGKVFWGKKWRGVT